MIEQRYMEVLRIICQSLVGQNIRWVLIGSTGLALQGVEIEPKDIDILTDKKGAFAIQELLQEYQVNPVKFSRSELFESYFGECKINDVKIEIMGDLKENIDNEWISVSGILASPKILEIEGIHIPVSPLEQQLRAYERLGREKDFIRMQKIKKLLDNEDV
jgi:predicted nucleotidyltransferase